MKKMVLMGFLAFLALSPARSQKQFDEMATWKTIARPQNYTFFGQDREDIQDPAFLNSKMIGAQITYPWKTLEPTEGAYDFSEIIEDALLLEKAGKKLFVQVQDVTFYPQYKAVPNYLLNDPKYNGGVDAQYTFANDNDDQAKNAGWSARRWDPAVADRWQKLISAMGSQLDGKIAGINMPETALDFGATGKYWPKGFTPAGYRNAIERRMTEARTAFKKSLVIQYVNFMPGEWLPWNDNGYMKSLFDHARAIGAGVGGPDLIPYRKGQMAHGYSFLPNYTDIPTGLAVQEGNYAGAIDPKTKKRMSVSQIYDFGADALKLKYIFWCTEQPYYLKEVLPFVNGNDAEKKPS